MNSELSDVTFHPRPPLLQWVPWEKITIWTLFLFLVYILRHFFFIIFMTFIIAYLMRGLIVFLAHFFSPNQSRKWLEQTLTVVCFILLVFSLYETGRFFVPRLVSQGQALVKKMGSFDESPRAKVDGILRNTVGQWLFQQEFGAPGDSKYDEAFDTFKQSGLRVKEYEDFERFLAEVDSSFEKDLFSKFDLSFTGDGLEKLPELKVKRAQPKTSVDKAREIESIKSFRDRNPTEYQRLYAQFYRQRRKEDSTFKYSYETFQKLIDAYKQDPVTFSSVFNSEVATNLSPDERTELDRAGFIFYQTRELAARWKQGPMAEKLGAEADRYMLSLVSDVGKYVGEIIPAILTLPIQLTLSLMLSFFLTFDIPRIAKGIERLRESRVRHFYEEIAPGLVNFGKLIGRAFRAQGVIALINSLLTLAAIKILGIENEAFLTSIVFICSFIPVLGVVFSGIPIATMAIIQDGGGIVLALWAIAAILVVHFIETSILNPKIVGTFLHLHPVLVLAILAIGEHFFGVWGLLLGVPVMVYIIRFVILDEGLPWEKPISDDLSIQGG